MHVRRVYAALDHRTNYRKQSAAGHAPVRPVRRLDHLPVLGVEHPPHVPELHGLVLAVGDEVAPVALGRDAGDARLVPAEASHLRAR